MWQLCSIAFLLTLSSVYSNQDFIANSFNSQQRVASGRASFLRHCSGCHGEKADGKGPAAPMLNPRPRDLVSGAFKFRSSPYGQLPTGPDLFRTIHQGVLGTAMPSFRLLSDQEKWSLVAYIQSLRPEFETDRPKLFAFKDAPEEIFSHKSAFLAAARNGQRHFGQACQLCHGVSGRGDGPSAATLKDTTGQPIPPADLTKPFVKSGNTARDLFKAITTGLDGTPMPGYADTFTEDERWEIVAFILFLRGKEAGRYPEVQIP